MGELFTHSNKTLTRHEGMNYPPSGTEGQNLIVSAAQAEFLRYFEKENISLPLPSPPKSGISEVMNSSSSRIRISRGNFSYFMHDLDAGRTKAPSVQAPFPACEQLRSQFVFSETRRRFAKRMLKMLLIPTPAESEFMSLINKLIGGWSKWLVHHDPAGPSETGLVHAHQVILQEMSTISPSSWKKMKCGYKRAEPIQGAHKHTMGINPARELGHQRWEDKGWKDKGGDVIVDFPSGERVHSSRAGRGR